MYQATIVERFIYLDVSSCILQKYIANEKAIENKIKICKNKSNELDMMHLLNIFLVIRDRHRGPLLQL